MLVASLLISGWGNIGLNRCIISENSRDFFIALGGVLSALARVG